VTRIWDAATYDRVADWQGREGLALVERLDLRGDETVLDAGCGTGRVARHLLDRLPSGRVVAVDASPEMLEVARVNLDDPRVELVLADLAALRLDTPVDAVVSGAAFHWVLDQDRLFAHLYVALRPGGRLLAWHGGQGSHAALYAAAADVGRREPFAPFFDGWTVPLVFPAADETAARLAAAGFGDIECRIEPYAHEHDSVDYFRTVSLGAHLQQLPEALRDPFLERVLATEERPYRSSINRLYLDARRSRDGD